MNEVPVLVRSAGHDLPAVVAARQTSPGRAPIVPLLTYLGAILIAQALISLDFRSAGLIVALLLVAIALASVLWIVGQSGAMPDDPDRDHLLLPSVAVTAALILPPLSIVITVGITWETSRSSVVHFADVPLLLIAAALAIRAIGLRRSELGVALPGSLWNWLITGVVGGLGAVVGWVLYRFLEPASIAPTADHRTVAVFCLLFMLGGSIEELLYRGVVRGSFDRAFTRVTATLFGAAIYASMTIGFESLPAVAIIFVTAVLADIAVRRTGSLLGVSLARGICLAFLFVLLPLDAAGLLR